jgi:hypothetical protein
MIAIGIKRPQSGIGAANGILFSNLAVVNKGVNNCIPNTGTGLEPGDIVSGWKDSNTYWIAAQYKGGDPEDRTNSYIPLQEVDMETYCTLDTGYIVPQPGEPNNISHYSELHYDSEHYST